MASLKPEQRNFRKVCEGLCPSPHEKASLQAVTQWQANAIPGLKAK